MGGRRWIVGANAWYVWVAKASRNQIDGEMQEIFPFLEWHHTRYRWHLTCPWWMPWRRTLPDCLGKARALAAALTSADEEDERIEAHRHALARRALGDAERVDQFLDSL